MTRWKLVYFLSGQIGIMLLARFLFQWILKYAQGEAPEVNPQAVVLFGTATVGIALLIFRILDGISDPLAGALSDGWSRRGKQRRAHSDGCVAHWHGRRLASSQGVPRAPLPRQVRPSQGPR